MAGDYLILEITSLASKSFNEDLLNLDGEKLVRWFSHWFRTAEDYKESLEKEGLTEEAEMVKFIIVDQRNLVADSPYYKTER